MKSFIGEKVHSTVYTPPRCIIHSCQAVCACVSSFIANTIDTPTYTLHFRADAPLDLKVLFFFPGFHTEKFGMGRLEAGVNLYSRKVLIEAKSKGDRKSTRLNSSH